MLIIKVSANKRMKLHNQLQRVKHVVSQNKTESKCYTFSRIGAIVMVILIMVTGCTKYSEGVVYESLGFAYSVETVSYSDDIGNINSFVYHNDKLYFAATAYEETDEEGFSVFIYISNLYSMNIDGSELTKLTGYIYPVKVPAGASGMASVYVMDISRDGDLWVVETWDFSSYNLPEDFNPEVNEVTEYYVSLGSGSTVRKLDSTGVELLSVDLSGIMGNQDYLNISHFCLDGSGNVYLCAADWAAGGHTIYIFDDAGSFQFELSLGTWIDSLICMSDGTVAFYNSSINVLQTIDFTSIALGDTISLPVNAGRVYSVCVGNDSHGETYDILIDDSENLYSFTVGDKEAVKLLNWLDNDIISNDIEHITMVSDDRIICTLSSYHNKTSLPSCNLLLLTKIPYVDFPQKIELTLATFNAGDVSNAVVRFNRISPEYRINIVDYSEFNSDNDPSAGLARLSTELISGRGPDIIDVSSLPYTEYARKGLFTDLYPYIDTDPVLNRNSFIDGVFRAAEIDGKLYQVFPQFCIRTIVGHPSIVGTNMGWNTEEFNAVLETHPEADIPLGTTLTKMAFLQASISFSIDNYIDWRVGSVSFDTPDFVQLLKYSDKFLDVPDLNSFDWSKIVTEDEAISTGRQIMAQATLYDFHDYQRYKALFGGEIAYKGIPNMNRNGNSLGVNFGLAILETSENKEAAWAFVRTVLDEDWQLDNTWWFPTNQTVFDVRFQEFNNLTLLDKDRTKDAIHSASGITGWSIDQTIWEIVSECVSDYFNGICSAEEAAIIIQSRVSIYVSERS